jgi:hypothetical protein
MIPIFSNILLLLLTARRALCEMQSNVFGMLKVLAPGKVS